MFPTPKTDVIAFGGTMYPIAKWMPGVEHYSSPLLGFSEDWCAEFATQIRRPSILVGFSSGANAVMSIAGQSSLVVEAYAHSCQWKHPPINYNCQYKLFITKGDRTNTNRGTVQTRNYLLLKGASVSFRQLPMVRFPRPTYFERVYLTFLKHIFHNALPYLPSV